MIQWHDKVPIYFRARNVSLSNIVDFGQVKNTKKKDNKTNYLPVPESTMLLYLILLTLHR